MMKRLKKWTKLPSPVELGKSDSNALEMRSFSPFSKNYCWEDYDAEMKDKYPFRFWLNTTLPHWWSVYVYMPLEDVYYHLKDKLITRHYLLDLRQGYNDFDMYQGGWCDVVEKMLYANFNLLKEFMEKEAVHMHAEQLNSEYMTEAKTLYYYWLFERKAEHDKVMQLYHKKNRLAARGSKDAYAEVTEQWLAAHDSFESKEDEMLMRLIKLRRYLWT